MPDTKRRDFMVLCVALGALLGAAAAFTVVGVHVVEVALNKVAGMAEN